MGLKDIALGHSKSQLRSAQPSPSVQKHTVYQTEFNANAMIGDKELHPCAPYSQYPEMTSIFSPAPRTLDDSDNLQIGATLKVFFSEQDQKQRSSLNPWVIWRTSGS